MDYSEKAYLFLEMVLTLAVPIFIALGIPILLLTIRDICRKKRTHKRAGIAHYPREARIARLVKRLPPRLKTWLGRLLAGLLLALLAGFIVVFAGWVLGIRIPEEILLVISLFVAYAIFFTDLDVSGLTSNRSEPDNKQPQSTTRSRLGASDAFTDLDVSDQTSDRSEPENKKTQSTTRPQLRAGDAFAVVRWILWVLIAVYFYTRSFESPWWFLLAIIFGLIFLVDLFFTALAREDW